MVTKKMSAMLITAFVATSSLAQTAEEQAKTWNEEAKKHLEVYDKENAIQRGNFQNKTANPFDTVAMYKAAEDALTAMMKCDEFDSQPNEKGKVKMKFRSKNQQRAYNLRIAVLQGGEFYRMKRDYENALVAYQLYVDSHDCGLLADYELMKADNYAARTAYMAAFLAYQSKKYPEAIKYAEKCKVLEPNGENSADADEVLLFAKKDNCKTAADSAAFISDIKALHKADPTAARYFNMLLGYYNTHPEQKMQWIEEEIVVNPGNKLVWAIKGEAEMNSEKYDEAIASYRKALEIDPTFVEVQFNLGTTLNSKAVALNEKLADKKTGGLTAENVKKVNAVLEEAKKELLKAKELDPNREKVNWAYALYRVYYSLKDQANYTEMEKLLNQ